MTLPADIRQCPQCGRSYTQVHPKHHVCSSMCALMRSRGQPEVVRVRRKLDDIRMAALPVLEGLEGQAADRLREALK